MPELQIESTARHLILACVASLTLGGCLMQEVAEDAEVVTDIDDREITGSVGDGPVVGANMRVWSNEGQMLLEFASDASAGFNITVRTRGKYYPLTIDADQGTDLVTGRSPDFRLVGAALEPSKRSVANVNPYSTIAMAIVDHLEGGRSKSNIELAQGIVVRALNSGLTTLASTGPMITEIDASNITEIVRSSEALGETVRRTRDWLAIAGAPTDGNGLIATYGADLVDGIVDGEGAFGADARTAAISAVAAAQVLLESMSNELRVDGVNATVRLESAIAQVGLGSASPTLSEIGASADALQQVSIGLAIADFLSDDPAVTGLRDAAAGIQAGMAPAIVRTLLPDNYRLLLENILAILAGSDAATLTTVTGIIQTGGELPSDNTPPVISGNPPTTVEAGTLYQFVPQASDSDNDALTFSITNRPTWATFEPLTGRLSGVPDESNVGDWNGISISVSDGEASTALPAFGIAVTSGVQNTAPTISGTPQSVVVAGSGYDFVPTAGDVDGDTLTFAIENRPSWAGFNAATGRLQGTPSSSDVGSYDAIVISVSDGQASASLGAFSILVQAQVPVNTPPTIAGSPPNAVEVGSQYLFMPSASDADGDSLTFSISGRPPWAGFNAATGALTGVPSEGDVGEHGGIVITVTDGVATASLPQFSISVTAIPNSPPVITGTPPATVTANSPYQFTPSASDPDGDTVTFTVSQLPPWAGFDPADGSISGVPGDGDVGSYPGIVITATDGTDSASLGPFGITVEAVSLGSATLSWIAPTQNTDGTPLTNLAGYRIRWGIVPGSYTNTVTVNNPGITSYVIENLAPGTYEFVATAYNDDGLESDFSNTAIKTIP